MKNKKVIILLIVIIALIVIGFVVFGATGLAKDIKSIKSNNKPVVAQHDGGIRYVGIGYRLEFRGGFGDTEWFVYLGNTGIKIYSFWYRHPRSGDPDVLF